MGPMRRITTWLLTLPLAIGGSQLAHAEAYRLVYADTHERSHVLAESGHGYLQHFPFAVALGLAVIGVALVSRARGRTGGARSVALRRNPRRDVRAPGDPRARRRPLRVDRAYDARRPRAPAAVCVARLRGRQALAAGRRRTGRAPAPRASLPQDQPLPTPARAPPLPAPATRLRARAARPSSKPLSERAVPAAPRTSRRGSHEQARRDNLGRTRRAGRRTGRAGACAAGRNAAGGRRDRRQVTRRGRPALQRAGRDRARVGAGVRRRRTACR